MVRENEWRGRVAALVVAAALAPGVGLAAPAEDNFAWYCKQCHGPKGAGDGINSEVEELPVGPMNLSKAKEIKKFSDAEIVKTVTKGGPANTLESLMPPWGNTFTTAEIEALMKYVRSLCQDADCP